FLLAQRMGLQLEYKKMITGASFGTLPPGTPLDMAQLPTAEDLVRIWCKGSRVDFDTLCAHPGGVLLDLPPVTVQPHADDGRRLALCPDDIRDELHAVRAQPQTNDYPFRLT